MPLTLALALSIHVLSAVIWVGGMFFAYMFLRPAAGALDPAPRLALWRKVFDGFLPWVWAAVIGLLASGYFLVFAIFGDFEVAGLHVHIMHAIAWIMALLFAWLYFVPYRRLGAALDENDVPGAAAALGRIRHIVAVNLTLGLVNVVVGSSGALWA